MANKPQPESPTEHAGDAEPSTVSLTRRGFFKGAGLTGVVAATSPSNLFADAATGRTADGTPEQIHLTWGEDPSSSVFVSWASPAQAVNPRVILRHKSVEVVIHAVQRTYTDGLNGQTVFTYHAKLEGLQPGGNLRPAPAMRRSNPAPRSTFAAIALARKPVGLRTRCLLHRKTRALIGSSYKCIKMR